MGEAFRRTLAMFTPGDWALLVALAALTVTGFIVFSRAKIRSLAGGYRPWGWAGFAAGLLAVLALALLMLGFVIQMQKYMAGST
ncbi:MAG: hypothetical protein ACOX17_00555 [Christensenellales bacterium]|jgi:hypothetical protein